MCVAGSTVPTHCRIVSCHDVGIDFQVRNPAWWHIPVITALRRLRQEDH